MTFELKSVEALAAVLEDHGIDSSGDQIRIDDLFSSQFMQHNTAFESIESFFTNSPWDPDCEQDVASIPEATLDAYVARHSTFDSWQEMVQQAVLDLFSERP